MKIEDNKVYLFPVLLKLTWVEFLLYLVNGGFPKPTPSSSPPLLSHWEYLGGLWVVMGFPGGSELKNPPAKAADTNMRVPSLGEDPGRKK